MLAKQIWFYISNRVDNDGVLPSEDEIYIAFVYHFEALGWNPDIIAEQVERYCDCSDLTDVDIQWEGKIDGISSRRTLSESEVPPKTA
jgi:hypothetical protein